MSVPVLPSLQRGGDQQDTEQLVRNEELPEAREEVLGDAPDTQRGIPEGQEEHPGGHREHPAGPVEISSGHGESLTSQAEPQSGEAPKESSLHSGTTTTRRESPAMLPPPVLHLDGATVAESSPDGGVVHIGHVNPGKDCILHGISGCSRSQQ